MNSLPGQVVRRNAPASKAGRLRRLAAQRRLVNLGEIVDSMPCQLLELDANGQYLSFFGNGAGRGLLPRADQAGATIADVLPGDASQIVMHALGDVARKRASTAIEVSLEVEGRRFWFELLIAPKTVIADRTPRFVIVARDVTQWKLDQQALLCRERQYRMLAENHPDSIIRLDVDGRVVFGNHAAFHSSNVSNYLAVGKTVAELGGAAARQACAR